jgi:hypothetical protein
MNACKALLMALCLSVVAAGAASAAGAPDDPAQALPLPAAPRWLLKARNGSLVIKSATHGAQVAVDGRAVGKVPLAALPIAPGRHQITLSKKGFVSATRRVRVLAGQRSLVAIDLLAEVAPLPLQPLVADAAPSPSEALTALIAAPPAPAAAPSALAAAPPAALAPLPSPPLVLEPLPSPPLVLAPALVARAPSSKAPPAALAPATSQPLTKKWWFWGGAAASAVVLAAVVTWALPALYVEHRDPAAACGGTCGIVVNK